MDDFEVIYTEEDIKAVEKKYEELSSRFQVLSKEKRDIEILSDALREKVRSFEQLTNDYSNTKAQMKLQQLQLDELHRQYDLVQNSKKDQDAKLIKVMKEKHLIQQELEAHKQDNEQMTSWMVKEMENVREEMTSTFNNQSKIQAASTRSEIQSLQSISQQRLIEKQAEYEELSEQLNEKTVEANQLSTELQKCKQQLALSQKHIIELSEKLDQERKQVEELKKQVSVVEKLRLSEAEKQQFSQQLEQLKLKNSEISSQLSIQKKQQQQDLLTKDAQVEELQKQIKALREQHSSLKEESSQSQNVIQLLKDELILLSAKENELRKVQAEKSKFEKLFSEKADELALAQVVVKEKEKDFNDILEESVAYHEKIAYLDSELVKVYQNQQTIAQQKLEVEKQLQIQEDNKSELQKQLTNKTEQLEKVIFSLEVARKECGDLQKQLQLSENSVNELLNKIYNMEQLLNSVKLENERQQQKVQLEQKQLNNEINKTEEEIKKVVYNLTAELQKEQAAAKKSAENEAAIKIQMEVIVNQNVMELKKAKVEYSQLKAELDKKDNMIKDARLIIEENTDKANKLTQQHEQQKKVMEVQIINICQEKENLQIQLAELTKEKEIMNASHRDLDTKLQQYQQQALKQADDDSFKKSELIKKVDMAEQKKFDDLNRIYRFLLETCETRLGAKKQEQPADISIESIEGLISKFGERYTEDLKKEREIHGQLVSELEAKAAQNAQEKIGKDQQDEMLLKQKKELKDLKFDLEQKVKKIQDDFDELIKKSNELEMKNADLTKENLEMKVNLEYSNSQQREIAQQYDKISQLEMTNSSLQSLLETQDIDSILLKKINDTNALEIQEEMKYQINISIIEQAKGSLETVQKLIQDEHYQKQSKGMQEFQDLIQN